MKKITTVFLMILVCAGLSAQVKFRMNGICDWDDEVEESYMGGLRSELVVGNVGFGFEAMGNTNCDERPSDIESYEAIWQGEMFLSYHLFESDSFIDPYLQAGYGCAGREVWSEELGSEELNLSLYPSFSAGVNAVFEGGLMLGLRTSYRPENNFIPGTEIDVYDLDTHQLTFNVGYQFGGRESRRQRDREDYGCWKWCWCDECDCD